MTRKTRAPPTCRSPISPRAWEPAFQGLRLGVPRRFFDRLDLEVRASVEAALVLLRDLGANVQDVDFPSVACRTFAIAGRPEGASFFGQFTRTRPQDYGDDRARAPWKARS